MFKRRSSQPQISPLPSPAATSTQPHPYPQQQNGRMSMQMPQPYRQGGSSYLDQSQPGPNAQAGSMRSRQSMQQGQYGSDEGGLLAGPQYTGGGGPVERVTSKASEKESTKDKRRSGLFGFGRKKEDKKEKEEKEKESKNTRQSFNVTRTDSNLGPNQYNSQQQPFSQQRLPSPNNPSPPVSQYQQGRIASNPSPRPGGGDFAPSDRMSKSQSMGFSQQQPGRVPDTHPYRGYLTGHSEQSKEEPVYGQGRPQGLPKSMSMPLDKATPPTPRDTASPSKPSPQHSLTALDDIDKRNGERDRERERSRTVSAGSGRTPLTGQPEWMKEFSGIVELIGMQPQKTYVASPPELEMILARTSAGGQPKQGQPGSASNDWDAVWLQLSGISLSMWSMKETRAAAARGEKVPPTYFNITDSSLELLAPLPPPPHRPNSHPHHHVFSLNTAGSNRLLFSCPAEADIARWATGLRLAAWERARLEEIYTGHLIKSGGKEPRMELQKGRMEGWVRVRVMGGTEWKRLWAVLSTPNPPPEPEDDKKAKRKSFFGMGGSKEEDTVIQEPNTGQPMASFYAEPRTPKNRSMAPVLTISSVTQAYAVFPERLEVISQSNLMKVVGRISGELVAIEGRLRESGWALIMPESPDLGTASPPTPTPLVNMMKWVTGVHDIFGLYGRPNRYSWDEKDPRSLFFAYPKGSERNRLFLDIEDAIRSDYRLSNLPQVRAQFVEILTKKGLPQPPPQSPRSRNRSRPDQIYAEDNDQGGHRDDTDYRLPPLSFDQSGSGHSPNVSDHSIPRSLSPITERTDTASRNNSQRTTNTERKVSGSSTKQQGSGSSKLNPPMEQSQLETITDADTFGNMMDEPREKSPSGIASPPSAIDQHTQNTGRSYTVDTQGESIYSQSTGVTPTPIQSSAASPSKNQLASIPAPTAVPPMPTVISPATSTPISPALAPPIAAPIPTQTQSDEDREPSIHSPTPRRVASTEFKADKFILHQEPAAQYLMNVVEEPHASPPSQPAQLTAEPERVRPTIITDFSKPIPTATSDKKHNENLGRKPSGARAPPPKKLSGTVSRLGSVDDHAPMTSHSQEPSGPIDIGEDAQAYLAYADQPPTAGLQPPPIPSPPVKSPEEEQPRSSFAPSKAAADRRAKADAVAAEKEQARNMPGGGRRKEGAKEEWSDEEDEDEDVEDSPVVESARRVPDAPQVPEGRNDGGRGIDASQSYSRQDNLYSSTGSIGRAGLRALPPVPQPQRQDSRSPRPNSQMPNEDDLPHPSFHDRPRSRSPAQYAQQSRAPSQYFSQAQNQSQPPPASRQTIWNANFAAGHGMPESGKSGKFVELEAPQAKLTQAFAPHGLLQAGLQDKEDRSAKKQEELAREMGSSLINVPSKPPPPSAGLLGAVAQHEKERKNAGGIGATLTDREREKRLAEDRQREIEKLQRQQAEHMRQFGDYGQGGQGQGYGGYGMGMPPMGMGMPPMGMGSPPMGFNPYQGGFNPYAQQQAMFAAQMAYQNAMMMSAAGSQHGAASPDRPASPTSGPGSQFGGFGGTASPFPQMPYGWPGAMPWMSPQHTGSPGMMPMQMPSFPSMHSFGPGNGDYLQPGGYGGGNGGSRQGTPSDQRSRVDSFHSGRDRSQDRNGAPAT